MAVDNFLSAGALITQRLIDAGVAPSNKVRRAQSASWVAANQLDGSVSVIFFDDQPDISAGGNARRGKTQASDQFWQIIVSSRNVADAGNAARQDAGVIVLQTLIALQGWIPSTKHGELYRQKSPVRATDNNGFVHMPLMFSTKVITTGSAV